MKKGLIILAAVTLLSVIGFLIYGQFQPEAEPRYENEIADLLPEQIEGWRVKDLPLGATESVSERSLEILRLDDYVYRQYEQGDRRFSVYVAYWRPGKMPLRLVQQHTPDRCWIENGWSCTDRDWNVVRRGPQGDLPPAQWGIYEIRGHQEHTYFWHLVDGQVYWPEVGQIRSRTSVLNFFKELATFGTRLKREQFLIRINSQEPFDQVWETEALQQILASMEVFFSAEG